MYRSVVYRKTTLHYMYYTAEEPVKSWPQPPRSVGLGRGRAGPEVRPAVVRKYQENNVIRYAKRANLLQHLARKKRNLLGSCRCVNVCDSMCLWVCVCVRLYCVFLYVYECLCKSIESTLYMHILSLRIPSLRPRATRSAAHTGPKHEFFWARKVFVYCFRNVLKSLFFYLKTLLSDSF